MHHAPALATRPVVCLPDHRSIDGHRKRRDWHVDSLNGAALANGQACPAWFAAWSQDADLFYHDLEGLLWEDAGPETTAVAAIDVDQVCVHPASSFSASVMKCLSVEVSFSYAGHRMSKERDTVFLVFFQR